ncbi:MAG: PilZ domain-containing protein [Desulfosarcina sp.]|nr:PilZ domain-containing protein [Desulfosarcina sp.]MBC2744688.1 PilZ domain-containing protein [Desulfosarcina sp.]MBC2767597.1 PilZ domain-containing protein [Desulfosarcina sp.]
MIDVRSQHIEVSSERRQYPRLEFRCTVLFGHMKGVLNVTDMSLNGLFVEVADKTGLDPGRVVSLAIKFPTEEKAILLKARVVNVNKRGVGCHFVDTAPKNNEAIKNCFETFRDTLPLR